MKLECRSIGLCPCLVQARPSAPPFAPPPPCAIAGCGPGAYPCSPVPHIARRMYPVLLTALLPPLPLPHLFWFCFCAEVEHMDGALTRIRIRRTQVESVHSNGTFCATPGPSTPDPPPLSSVPKPLSHNPSDICREQHQRQVSPREAPTWSVCSVPVHV